MGRNATFEPRKDEARGRWWISIPPRLSETGKRQKRYFKTKDEALGAIQRIKVRKENHGTAAKLLSPADEQQAASALKLLRNSGCTTQLTVIVGEYLERLRRRDSSKPLSEAWDAYLNRGDKDLSKVHRRSLLATKKRMVTLHSKLVAEISSHDIEACMLDAAPTYRNAMLREIRSVLNWCMSGARKWLTENPANDCEFAAVDRAKEVQIYTPIEIKKLMQATVEKHPDLVPAVALMTFAGVRPDHLDGEIVKLEWSHILHDDRHDKRIELPGGITKTGKQRSVKIRPSLLSWIQWHIQRGGTRDGLVCPVKGQALRKKMREVFDESNVTRIQDGFRHSFASYLAPVDGLDVVETELGHQGGREVLNRHYRTDVRKTIANQFWAIRAGSVKST
jgi:integrase